MVGALVIGGNARHQVNAPEVVTLPAAVPGSNGTPRAMATGAQGTVGNGQALGSHTFPSASTLSVPSAAR